MNDPTKPFSLTLWGSHPEDENDDCWTGEDYATEAEARADLALLAGGQVPAGWDASTLRSTSHFMVDGPDISDRDRFSRNPRYTKPRADPVDCEAQYQAAMAFGCQGWNDYEGA